MVERVLVRRVGSGVLSGVESGVGSEIGRVVV